MKRLATVFALSATVFLSGCGGAPGPPSIVSIASPTPLTPSIPNFAGNWLFSTASTVPGKPPLTFAGSISQANSAVSGALHVDGSTCFNQVTTMGLTGTVTADGTSLTSTALGGQVVTFTGNFTSTTFTGTYSINGGCAGGDQGSVTGANFSYIATGNSWSGTLTSSTQNSFTVSGEFAQSTDSSTQGSFAITGAATAFGTPTTFDSPCFSAGTIIPGVFPNGSFILGNIVSLEIQTDNGFVVFLGTANPLTGDGKISGQYNVSGGTCDQTGTAVLVFKGQWDY